MQHLASFANLKTTDSISSNKSQPITWAARAITTTKHVGVKETDLDFNSRKSAWPRQSRVTQTNYSWGVTYSYNHKQIQRRKSWRPRLSSLSLSYKSRSLPPLQSLLASMTLTITRHPNQLLRGVISSYHRVQIQRRKSWRPRFSSLSLSYKS